MGGGRGAPLESVRSPHMGKEGFPACQWGVQAPNRTAWALCASLSSSINCTNIQLWVPSCHWAPSLISVSYGSYSTHEASSGPGDPTKGTLQSWSKDDVERGQHVEVFYDKGFRVKHICPLSKCYLWHIATWTSSLLIATLFDPFFSDPISQRWLLATPKVNLRIIRE